MHDMLETIEAGAKNGADFSVIWLHGLGADGYDFLPIVDELALPEHVRVRFVFPHAPRRPITINGGAVMRGWYDIVDLALEARSSDEAGIRDSSARVHALVAREIERGVPAQRIVLAGFSQGGAIAIHAALRYPQRLLGLIALSCYAVLPETMAAEASPASQGLPAFVAHGAFDPVVPFAGGEDAALRLRACGLEVTWRSYEVPHAVHPREIEDIGRWLSSRFD